MPVVEKFAGELQGQVEFYYVDLDQDRSMAQGFDIMGVPVLVKMQGGKPVNRVVGFVPEEDVRAFAQA